ncbi:MAG: MATE family efflux transporter [Alphaproteobacteria bacterium]|nr:MATE family efflux transporter [Alphaproteobacteria bacterium]
MNTQQPQLGTDPISKLLWIFAPPAIIGLLINASYNLIDRIFVGNGIGSLGLAAITVSFPSMTVQLAVGLLVGIGGSVNFSVSLGQNKIPRAERIFTNAVMLIVFFVLLFISVHLLFLEPLLKLYGATPTIMPYAKTYLSIISFGSIFVMTNMTLNNFIRASGFPRFAMYTMLIGAIMNTILDALFIFVFKWGIAGAATATIIAQAVSFLWASSFFISAKAIYRFRRKYMLPSLKIISMICFIGAAPFLIQITYVFMQTVINKSLVQYGGDTAVSAMGATLAVTILLFMPVTGLCEGMQPVIGFNLGAKKYDRMLKVFRLNLVISTVFFVFSWGLLQLFPDNIIRLFNNQDQELIKIGTQSLKIISLLYPFIGLPIATTFFLQAVKHPHTAAFLAVGRQLLFIIPALSILPRYFGLAGVFYAFPTADFLGFLMAVPFTVQQFKKYGKQNEATKEIISDSLLKSA